MRSLVLNNFFTGWSGSELVALEVAEALGATCSAFVADGPILDALPAWRPLDQIDLHDFDFVWAQHGAVLPLLDRLPDGAERPAIAFVRLSPYEPSEIALPSMLDAYADRFVANSQETAEAAGRPATVLQNAAPDPFHFARQPRPLRRVLMVGNYLPPELRAAADLLRAEGLSVRIVGAEDKVTRILPAHIEEAEAVVTIGKTARYALASGTPVYVYGRFGGEGYVTAEDYAEAEAFNFSGRPACRALTPDQIAGEIVAGHGWWSPPPQPRLSAVLDSVVSTERHPFRRHPDLAAAAAMATALSGWLIRANALEQRLAAYERGDTGSWSWLAACVAKKLRRTPRDVAGRLRSLSEVEVPHSPVRSSGSG